MPQFPGGLKCLTREQLLHKRRQWERFNAWEAANSRERSRPDEFSRALRWLGEAWELAQKLNPQLAEGRVDLDKIRHIQKTREYLARLTR